MVAGGLDDGFCPSNSLNVVSLLIVAHSWTHDALYSRTVNSVAPCAGLPRTHEFFRTVAARLVFSGYLFLSYRHSSFTTSSVPAMDQISRPYSHDIFYKASYRRPSFLSSVLPPTINSGHDSPAHLGSSEKVHPSQYGILASRALLTPPSSDVGTIRRCGCANDSEPASRNHTNGDRHSPLSSRASSQHFEWPSTPTRRPLLSPNPRCHGLGGTSKLNPSIESYTFPPTGNTRDRSAMISASEHSSLNEMTFVPPPPYRRTPPPVDDFAEALAEHAHYRPATTLRKSSEVMHNAHSEYSTNALGLDFTTHLPTPSPSPPSSLTDRPTPTETSTTSLSVPKRRRLRITIPESPTTCGTPSPPRPVTALYYPQSGAGDICPSPPVEDSLYRDSVFPEVHDHASVTSYDERGSALSSKSVRFAEETVQYSPQYSPQSPPRLARWKCIPLPPDYLLEESLHSPVDVPFAMFSLHDDDYASHLGFTHDSARCIKEQLLPVTNLPQDTGVDLLSPLPLTPAPSYCLEDLQQQISQCLDSTDRIYSVGLCVV